MSESSKPASGRVASWAWTALLVTFAVPVAWLAWRSRGWPLIHDAPILHYLAWRIGEGAAPYRDLFDMNAPGTYLVHLAVLGAFGPGDVAWRVFDLGCLAAGALAVAALAAPWGGPAAVGGALFFALYHLASGPWQTGQRDFLLCPLLLLGALGVARWMEARQRVPALLWAGLALGAAVTIKPHVLLFAAALGVAIVAAGRRAGASSAALFAAALASPPLAAVGWVAARGGLAAWWQITVDYLLPHYAHLRQPDPGFHRWHVWIPVGIALALSLGSAVAARRLGARHVVAALGLAYGTAHFVLQDKGWEYHAYPAAAFGAALLFSELAPLLQARRWAAAALLASLLATAGLLGAKGVEAGQAADGGWISAKARRVTALVNDLRHHLRPGDLVQVLDTAEGGIHALLRLGVAQPSRFVYDFPLFHDDGAPTVRRLRAELVRELDRRPPRCIVLFARGWPAGGYERVATFPELHRVLGAAYREAARGEGYIVYAKRNDP